MPETELRDKLTSYISDAVAMGENVDQMLPGMISTADVPPCARDSSSIRRRPGRSRSGSGAPRVVRRVRVVAQGDGGQGGGEEEAVARFIEEHWDDVAVQSLREEGVLR